MGIKKPVQIGEHYFPTQSTALDYFKLILNSYKPKDALTGTDFDDVYELIKRHPDGKSKIGKGIKEIYIDKDPYNGQCFHIKRIDDSTDNFSYKKAVSGEYSSFTIFSKACRKAVELDMQAVKDDFFQGNPTAKCQETGEQITPETSHVDHRQPNTFSIIVDRFIELNDINIEEIEYITIGKYGKEFKESELAEKFRTYHKTKAKLRVVSKEKNLQRSYLGRVQTQKKDLLIK